MGLHITDWLVLLGYFIFVTLIGWWSRKLIKTQGDFIMGGRRFGGALLSFLSFGSGTHTDQAVITAGAAYKHGFSGIWIQMIWLFVTPFYWLMAPVFRRARCYTVGDIMERRFGVGMATAYTILGVLKSTLVMGMMLKAAAMMFTGMVGGSREVTIPLLEKTVESGNIVILIMTALFVTYGVLGGLIAAVWTDVLQGVLTIVLSFLMVPFALMKVGGFAGIHTRMPNSAEVLRLVSAASGIGVFFIIMSVINGIINNAGQPGTIMGFAAGQTEVEGRVGKVYGNMLKRFCIVGWALIGVIGIIVYPGIPHEEVFGHAAHDLLPVGLVGLMLAAAMAAMMSTCDVMMVGASGLFTENVWRRFIVRKAEERHYVLVNRIAAFVIVAGGITFAYTIPSLIEALTWLWAWPTFMGMVFWLGVFMKRANAWGGWLCFLSASAIYVFCKFAPGSDAIVGMVSTFPGKFLFYPLYLRVVANLSNLAVLPWLMLYYLITGTVFGVVGSLLTPAPDRKRVEDYFLTISTPIGEEEKLEAAGVEILYK